MKKLIKFLFVLIFFSFNLINSQTNDIQRPSWIETLEYKFVPSITDQIKDGTFIPADENAHKKIR